MKKKKKKKKVCLSLFNMINTLGDRMGDRMSTQYDTILHPY